MRVSTAQIFDSGTRGIGRNQFDLFKLQNQLATGRKVLTPEDDPIAAAQALVLTQTKEVSSQFLDNQGDAKGKLGTVDAQLSSLTDLLQNVRERVVQAGNTTLTNTDRSHVAQELEARFSELMGIANAQDGAGNYLFSGYQGAVKPFSVSNTGAAYAGDDGQRLLQVESSRQIPTNISGRQLFETIRSGNGSFTTATGGNTGGGINQGTAVVDQGSVNNQSLWSQALVDGYGDVEIRFAVNAGVTQYELYDVSSNTLISAAPTDFVPGQAITLQKTTAPAQDFGVSVIVEGSPAAGDRFMVAPSTSQSVFTTLRNTINTLTQGIGSVASGNSTTEFVNDLGGNLMNIDQALENITRMRATVGSNLKELDSLGSAGEDLQLQYAASLSDLQDLDYSKAITDMARKQLQLEAAQLSFKQISQLSLFSIL
ncbi:MAG: flagellar hook-associated protein FlgL [Dechloromonas sp.]|nr:flagellar hook-associated protein FlgL [Dechloromonas sp.]